MKCSNLYLVNISPVRDKEGGPLQACLGKIKLVSPEQQKARSFLQSIQIRFYAKTLQLFVKRCRVHLFTKTHRYVDINSTK